MKTMVVGTLVAFLLTTASVFAASPNEDDFDRLDGKGISGKKVDVIEWEGNLEIHVYPKGSLAGLAMKIDDKNDRKVMVIGYRFTNNPGKQLIRRAILGIDLKEGFHAWRDSSADDYDKVIVSNHDLAGSKYITAFRLDPQPGELYPEGHPMRGDAKALAQGEVKDSSARKPASKRAARGVPAPAERPVLPVMEKPMDRPPSYYEDDGRIRHFSW